MDTVAEPVVPVRVGVATERRHDGISPRKHIFIRPSPPPVSAPYRLIPRAVVRNLPFRRHQDVRVRRGGIVSSEIHPHKRRHRAFRPVRNIHQQGHEPALVLREKDRDLTSCSLASESVTALFQNLEMQPGRPLRLISVHLPPQHVHNLRTPLPLPVPHRLHAAAVSPHERVGKHIFRNLALVVVHVVGEQPPAQRHRLALFHVNLNHASSERPPLRNLPVLARDDEHHLRDSALNPAGPALLAEDTDRSGVSALAHGGNQKRPACAQIPERDIGPR